MTRVLGAKGSRESRAARDCSQTQRAHQIHSKYEALVSFFVSAKKLEETQTRANFQCQRFPYLWSWQPDEATLARARFLCDFITNVVALSIPLLILSSSLETLVQACESTRL